MKPRLFRDRAGFLLGVAAMVFVSSSTRAQGLAIPGNRIFHEDFSQGLDRSADGTRRWMTAYPFGLRQVRTLSANHETECYGDGGTEADPFSIARSPDPSEPATLTITAAASNSNPCGLPYLSGLLTTFGSFNFRYGYAEAHVAVPQGAGVWPAFWLVPSDNLGRSELDIMETWGFDPGAYYATGISQPAGINDQSRIVFPDDRQFHRFGVDWEADRITWYLDGTAVKVMATPAEMHTSMYVLLNLAIYGPGSFQSKHEAEMTHPPRPMFPARMLVSDVAVYRTAGTQSVDDRQRSVAIPAGG